MYFIEILLASKIYKFNMLKNYLNKIKDEKYNVINFLFFVLGIWLILMGSLWGLSLFL